LIVEQKLQEETITNQRNYLLWGGLGFLILIILSSLLFRQNKLKKEANKTLTLQRDKIKLLNQELNHRVKNNLAFMTSLLEMQGRRSESQETKQVLLESESRLKALSLVHSNLFKNKKDTDLNLADYLSEIAIHLQDIFDIPDKVLTIKKSFVNYTINAEEAIKIGLIVNELITNSIKHAFTNVNEPEIKIETHVNKNDKLMFKYQDNGPGISEEILLRSKTETMGTKLISLLVRQIGGEISRKGNSVQLSGIG